MANLGFNPLVDPATQAQIDRQRQYAQLLQQQSMTPAEGQMVSGHYVAPSWTQGLARLMQGYTAGKINRDTDVQQSGLWKNQMAALAQMLSPNSQAAPSTSPSDVMGAGATASPNDTSGNNTGGVGPTTGNAQTLDSMPPTQPSGFVNQGSNNFNMANLLKSNAISSLGGDAAGSAFWKQYEPTDLQRNSNWMGISPQQQQAAALRELAAKGQTEVKPGGTVTRTNADGSISPLFTAPDNGINTTYQNGQPQAAPVPGYASALATNTAATEGAKANLDMVTVDDGRGGTIQMPRSQAIQLTGTQPQPSNGLPTNNFNTPYPVTFGAPGTTATDKREGTMTDASVAVRNPSNPNPNIGHKPSAAQLSQDQEVAKSTGEAAVNAAKVKAAADPLLAQIADARQLVDKLPYGATAPIEDWAANQKYLVGNPDKAAAIAQWEKIMGNFTMNGIASSGLGRMDIPIVNAINKASQVGLEDSPAAKRAALDTIESALHRHVNASSNIVSNLNQPGITSTQTQLPMPAQANSQPSSGGWAIKRIK